MLKDGGRAEISGRVPPRVTRGSAPTPQQHTDEPAPGPESRTVIKFLEEQPLWFYGVALALVVMIVAFALLMAFS